MSQLVRANTLPMASRPGKRSHSAPAWRIPLQRLQTDEDRALQQLAAVFSVRWQCFLEESGMWFDYDRPQAAKIEAAWLAEESSVRVGTAHDDEQWEVNFIAMFQKNVWTERLRPVRRVLVTHS